MPTMTSLPSPSENNTKTSQSADLGKSSPIPWEERFRQLVKFKKMHGHCNVTTSNNPVLGRWVKRQRGRKKMGKLTSNQLFLLEFVGFSWGKPLEGRSMVQNNYILWEQRFMELVEYKRIYGHCHVPVRFPSNPALGRWARRQRQYKKDGTLLEERMNRLDSIGFFQDAASQQGKITKPIKNSKQESRVEELIERGRPLSSPNDTCAIRLRDDWNAHNQRLLQNKGYSSYSAVDRTLARWLQFQRLQQLHAAATVQRIDFILGTVGMIAGR